MASVVAVLFSGGCALRHGDLALGGKLLIELSPPTGSVFYGVLVAEKDDQLVVSGFGRRPAPRGHVEIAVTGPDGAPLAHVRAEPLPPRAVPNRSYNYRFRVAVPLVPPVGSTLHIAYVLPSTDATEPEVSIEEKR